MQDIFSLAYGSNRFLSLAFVAIFCLMLAEPLTAQTTEFTYQGSLKDGVNVANGNYDFEFALFDTLTAGPQVGSTVMRSPVAVSGGIFSVSLDFGNQFPGTSRFLELRVRPTGGGSFNTLSPRQQIDSAPYSVKSLNTDTATNAAQLGGVAATSYVVTTDPRMTDARNPVAGSGNYIQNQNAGPQSSSNFNISGTGTAGGTLTGNIINSATTFRINNATVLSATNNSSTRNTAVGLSSFAGSGSDNAVFGYFAGISVINTGNRNSLFGASSGSNVGGGDDNTLFGYNSGNVVGAGSQNAYFGSSTGVVSTGSNNSFIGYSSGSANTTGNRNTLIGSTANVGTNNLTNSTAIGANAQVDQINSLVLGSITGVNGATANTNVGIGTTAPEKEFHVRGPSAVEIMIQSSDATGRKWSAVATGDAGAGRFEIVDRTAVASRMTILSGGNVGIGTTSPSDKLHVSGDIRVGTGTTGCVKDSDATVIAGVCSSDLRFKKDITPFSNVLNDYSRLRPVNFFWRADEFTDKHFGTRQSFGLIAQEVEQLFPDLVSTDEQGYKAVNYSKLPLLTIQAVKEQQEQIETQRSAISDQQSVISSQQTQIERQQNEINDLRQIVCGLKRDAKGCGNK